MAALFLAFSVYSFAEEKVSTDDFAAAQFQGKKAVIPYRYKHFDSASGEVALFVFLHGNSASGTDNKKQLEKDTLLNAVSYIQKQQLNVFVLAPQSPSELSWTALGDDVKSLVETFAKEHGAASARIFLVGESKGAVGVWSLVNRYPDFASKAVAMATSPKNIDAKKLLKTPIYAIVGELDTVGSNKKEVEENGGISPKIKANSEIVAKVQKLGGEAHLKIIDGADHYETCRVGLSSDVLDWLFLAQ